MKKQEVTIIGAGLAGALLACYLGQRGYRVQVFELRPDVREKTITSGRSINLALAYRGLRALKEVGLAEQVLAHSIMMRGRMLHDHNGKLTLQPYGRTEKEVNYSISRNDLNQLLLDAAQKTSHVSIHFQCRLTRVDFAKKEITVHNGISDQHEHHAYSHIVGCDGAHSMVRQAIHEKCQLQFEQEPLGHAYKEFLIPSARNGEHQMDANALHIWPRGEYMLIALANKDGSFTVTLFLPTQGENSFATLTTPADVQSLFNRQFPDASALIGDCVKQYFAHPTGALATIRTAPWSYQDQALILGDAAHAIVPFHGQGMNCAFEDCQHFVRYLEQYSDDWQALFEAFYNERKTNCDAIAQMAIENYLEMRSLVCDAKFVLKKHIAWLLEERYPSYFIPRYAMVMFYSIPYQKALRRGEVEAMILEALCQGITSAEQLDWTQADKLISQHLIPMGPLEKDNNMI